MVSWRRILCTLLRTFSALINPFQTLFYAAYFILYYLYVLRGKIVEK